MDINSDDGCICLQVTRPGQGGYNRIRGKGLVERVLVEHVRQHATLDDLKMMVELLVKARKGKGS